jgi:CPA1 family monovalent cation:H+ antiporter
MGHFDLTALLLTLAAVLSWTNFKLLRLPHEIGLVVTGLAVSLLLVAARHLLPGSWIDAPLADALKRIDFTDVLMNGMLAFLIFAGALTLDLKALRRRAFPVAMLALVGTGLSTAVVGLAFWGAAQLIGHPMPLAWALVFGALISPTDPVAVVSTLKHVSIPAAIETEMQGEALFNDGVGIVIFTVLVGSASGGADLGAGGVALDLLREAGGGIALGLGLGYAAYRAMRSLDDYQTEVLITLALVAATYAAAQALGASGPLAVVAAGLLVGEKAPQDAMSDNTADYVTKLWTLIEDVLNSVLFLLIGLEMAVLTFDGGAVLLAGAAVPCVLLGRLAAVSLPIPFRSDIPRALRNLPFLTWAGVRGGISVALALSLPDGGPKTAILAATYAVVIFTVVVQGSTLRPLARRTLERPEEETA